MDDCKFKVGDLIVPLPIADKNYLATNCNMRLAQVINVFGDGIIEISVLDHKDQGILDKTFTVKSKHFEKYQEEYLDVRPLVDKMSFDSIL